MNPLISVSFICLLNLLKKECISQMDLKYKNTCVCVCVCVCVCLYPYPFTLSWYSPLSEIPLDVVRRLIQLKGFNQCINKESSSERRNYIQVQQTDLPYANAKDLIQSGRIQIIVVCLSLVSFHQLSFQHGPKKILYHLFVET